LPSRGTIKMNAKSLLAAAAGHRHAFNDLYAG
jgi:hypothetical protein